jgi:hypothetical protein
MVDFLIVVGASLAFIGFMFRPQGHAKRPANKNRRG